MRQNFSTSLNPIASTFRSEELDKDLAKAEKGLPSSFTRRRFKLAKLLEQFSFDGVEPKWPSIKGFIKQAKKDNNMLASFKADVNELLKDTSQEFNYF